LFLGWCYELFEGWISNLKNEEAIFGSVIGKKKLTKIKT
jgi:hypothetical protein